MFEFDGSFMQCFSGSLAFTDIGNERDGASSGGRGDVIQTDFNREEGSILPLTVKVAADQSGMRLAKVSASMVRVTLTKGWRNQLLDGFADQLFGRPAEHRCQRMIRRHDRTLRVHDNNALSGGFQEQPEFAIAFLVA